MAAPLGNQFWKARSSHGRKPIFTSAEQIWEAACEYFEWVEANPLWEAKAFSYEGKVTLGKIPKMRAMTMEGLYHFIDVSAQSWCDYRQKEDFSEIIREVENVIRNQKFTGAAADLLNANIIARDLGLAEKKEHTGKDGERLIPPDLSVYIKAREKVVKDI